MLHNIVRDMKHGCGAYIVRPVPAVAAVLSLALGIGVNTALLSIVNAALLQASPIRAREQVVQLYSGAGGEYPQLTSSFPDYQDVARQATAFSGVAAAGLVRGLLSLENGSELVTGEVVTGNYFRVLGLDMAIGVEFPDGGGESERANPVVVLSHELWHRRFEGRKSIVGEHVVLSGRPYTVIGVASKGVTGTLPGVPIHFWTPVGNVEHLVFSGIQWSTSQRATAGPVDRFEQRGTRWLFVWGRLAPEATLAQARRQVETIFDRLRSEHSATNGQVRPTLLAAGEVRFHPQIDGYLLGASGGAVVAAGLVLLIACANFANFVLARGVARRQETAIRSVLGATRGRLVQQMICEAAPLVLAASVLGTVLGWWCSRAVSLGTDVFPVPVRLEVSVDTAAMVLACGVCLVAALGSCIAPLWASTRTDVAGALRHVPSVPGWRVSAMSALVVAQLAFSVILIMTGGLLGRGLLAAQGLDPGFGGRHLSSFAFNLQMNGYDLSTALRLRDRALEVVRRLPIVTSAALASRLPLSPDILVRTVHVDGYHTSPADRALVDAVSVGADYFSTVGVEIVAGRGLLAEDIERSRRVAVVNETMARQFWPGGDALGRDLHLSGPETTPFEVVGIARDHKVRFVAEAPRPYIHLPYPASHLVGLVVRTAVPATSALTQVRQALRSVDPGIVFIEEVTALEVAAETMAPTRIGAQAVGAFGALGLLLAAIGLYGLTDYILSLRTREMGIRIALGASARVVRTLVLADTGRLVAAGLVLGMIGAVFAGRFLSALLYGVGAADPWASLFAVAVLGLVGLVASLGPARSASQIHPWKVLQ